MLRVLLQAFLLEPESIVRCCNRLLECGGSYCDFFVFCDLAGELLRVPDIQCDFEILQEGFFDGEETEWPCST